MNNLTALKSYVDGEYQEAAEFYGVAKYLSQLDEIKDICLKMGYECSDKKELYENYSIELNKKVSALTEDYDEQSKLYNFINRITVIAKNYWRLNN